MEIEYKLEPWPHIIIDNFLDKDHFELEVMNAKEAARHCLGDRTQVRRSFPRRDHIRFLLETFFHSFDDKREYDDLGTFMHYAITPPNFKHTMHVDAPFKIMSSVLYLSPEENAGTRLYKTPDSKPIAVEWKPNRMFVFCGKDDVTWHDYTSISERLTLNHFFVDRSKIENLEYRNKCFI